MSRAEETVTALEELEQLLRRCHRPVQADWIRDARDRRDFAAVRNALAGMGSISDVSLDPAPEVELSLREAHEQLRELVSRLDRLTDPSPKAPAPPRMIRVGQSSTDLPDR
jgi:hypothetical protein